MNYSLASAPYSLCIITNEHVFFSALLIISIDFHQTDMDHFDKQKVKLGGNLFNQMFIREVERILELIGQILGSWT